MDENDNILFHFNPRPCNGHVVMNSRINNMWGREEVARYDIKKEVNLEVTVTSYGFLIFLNDEFFHYYKARIPWETFSSIRQLDTKVNV